MTENETPNTNATQGEQAAPDWSPKIRRAVAMVALDVNREQLFALKLRRRKEGNTTFYDPEQISALMALRHHWLRTAR